MPRTKPLPIRSRCHVALDDRDLEQVAGRDRPRASPSRDRAARPPGPRSPGWSAHADDARPAPARGDAEVDAFPGHVHRAAQRPRRRPARHGHPTVPGHERDRCGRRAAARGAWRSSNTTRSARRPGVTAPRLLSRKCWAGFHVASRMAVTGSIPSAMALPDGVVDAASVDEVGRLAIVGAEAEAMLVGRRHERARSASRSRATVPSRIITIMPRRSFSSASSAVVDSWSDCDAGRDVGLQRRPR